MNLRYKDSTLIVYLSIILYHFILLCHYNLSFAHEPQLSKELYKININTASKQSIQPIFDLAQDHKGYIYVATNKGIYKFDGFQFKQLNEKVNYYFGGSSIKFSKEGRLFYENFDGNVFSYDKSKQWKLYNQNKPVHYLTYGLFEEYLSFVEQRGIAIYDLRSNKQTNLIPYQIGYPQYTSQTDKHYYLVNEKKLAKFDNKKVLKEYILPEAGKATIIHQLYLHNNRIYIVPRSEYYKGIIELDLDLNYINTLFIQETKGIINNIQFIDNNILILTTKGIYVHRQSNNKWKLENALLENFDISHILKGQNNEYWISTLGHGLYLVPNTNQFLYKIKDEIPSTIISLNNKYLVGSYSGNILEINKGLNKTKKLAQSSFKHPIQYIYQHNSDKEIFYVSATGFNVLVGNENQFYDKALKSICYIDDDFYAIATSSDILLFKAKTFKNTSKWINLFNNQTIDHKTASLLNGKRSKSIVYNKKEDKIYFLTNVGLFSIDPQGNKKEILNNQTSIIAEKMDIIHDTIYLLYYDGQIITYAKEKFNYPPQLKENIISFKSIDDKLLIKSNEGFQLYYPNNKSITKMPCNIQTTTVNDYTYDKEDNLLALTNEGIIQIPKENNIKNIDLNAFDITNIAVNGLETTIESINQLSHHQNNIDFEYAFLDFSNPTFPDISYRINKSTWKKLPVDTRNLQFHQLAPGKYTIDFKIQDSVIESKITFKILPPFWQTWLFYLLISIILISCAYVYFNSKRKNLKQHINLLEEKISLEKELSKSILTSIKAQMNPHFFFNALNSIQAFIYKNDSRQAISYLSKFSKLTRIILNQTDVDQIKLKDEISMLQLYLDLEAVRFNHNFTYIIRIDDSIDENNTHIPAMLIQPYVENCIKHGFLTLEKEGKIKIEFTKNNDILNIKIEDNGIGRAKAQELQQHISSASFSTNANKKRLDILNQYKKVSILYTDLKDQNNESIGTLVELFIPTKK